MLGFEIVLPTFLPSETTNVPQLKIQRAFEGDRERELVATYYEGAGSTDGVRVRITQANDELSLDNRSDSSLGTVNGFDIKFLTNTFGSGAEFTAVLTRADVNIFLEIAWLVRVPSRDEMREEAKKIIASIQRVKD